MNYETLDPATQRVSPPLPLFLTLTNNITGRRLQRVRSPPYPEKPLFTQPSRAFNFGEFVDSKAQQPIPPTIAADEPEISAFRDLCYNLTLKLNTLLGIGLQVSPEDFFTKARMYTQNHPSTPFDRLPNSRMTT